MATLRCCPRLCDHEGSSRNSLSRLDHTAFALPVYASQSGSPQTTQHSVRLLARLCRVGLSPTGINARFQRDVTSWLPPCPSFPGAPQMRIASRARRETGVTPQGRLWARTPKETRAWRFEEWKSGLARRRGGCRSPSSATLLEPGPLRILYERCCSGKHSFGALPYRASAHSCTGHPAAG